MSEIKKSGFDFTTAVTQAFQTKGGRQFGLRLWFWLAACYTIVSLITLPMLAKYYPLLLDYNWRNLQSGEIMSEAESLEFLQLFVKMIPAYIVMILGVWLSTAAAETALHRRLFFNVEHQKLPLRLGTLELKVMLAQLGVVLLMGLIYLVLIICIILLITLSMSLSHVLGGLITMLSLIFACVFLIHMMIRLCPAGAMTVEQNKTIVFGAMPVAKKRTASLFMAYLVVGLGGYIAIYLIVGVVSILIVGNADVLIAMSGLGNEAPSIAFETLGSKLKNPFFMLVAILGIIAYSASYALMSVCIFGIGAYALNWYRRDRLV